MNEYKMTNFQTKQYDGINTGTITDTSNKEDPNNNNSNKGKIKKLFNKNSLKIATLALLIGGNEFLEGKISSNLEEKKDKVIDWIMHSDFKGDYPNEQYLIFQDVAEKNQTLDMATGPDKNYTSTRHWNGKLNESLTGYSSPQFQEKYVFLRNVNSIAKLPENAKSLTLGELSEIMKSNPEMIKDYIIKR